MGISSIGQGRAVQLPNLIKRHGLILYYRDGKDFPGLAGKQYFHNPEHAIACVGREPDWVSVGDDNGSYKWKLQTHILHVMFSLIDYQIYRISCFAPFLERELFPVEDW